MHAASLPDLPASISSGWRIGLVHSTFHADVVDGLVEGAERMLMGAGIVRSNIRRYAVPGSFEIPLIGAALLAEQEVDALIALGVIVEGETHHARLLAENVTRGIMDLQLQYRVPFAFEVLYVDDISQARERAGEQGNRGAEAARAVLHSLAQLNRIRS